MLNDPSFDPRAYEDFLEDDILKKIEEFKRKFIELKEKTENDEKEVAYSEIRVEEIVKKTREIEYVSNGDRCIEGKRGSSKSNCSWRRENRPNFSRHLRSWRTTN